MSEIDEVPDSVCQALLRLHGPNEVLEAMRRAYGPERAEFEYEGSAHARKLADRREADEALVAMARKIADENGWEWADVVAQAQAQLGVDENWQSAEYRRVRQLESEHSLAARAEADRRRKLMEDTIHA